MHLTIIKALITCADLIRGNQKLQEEFAQLQVTSVIDNSAPHGSPQAHPKTPPKVFVIDALLDLTLTISSTQAFDARLAACECIKSYFTGHNLIRKHFLQRAIEGHISGADETANVLSTLMTPPGRSRASDPYHYWLASVLLFHLIYEDSEAKAMAMGIAEGDASSGEEVVTCIQSLAGNLIVCLHKGEDDRVAAGYLMLLCGWLFEDPDAVNDFLGEGSSVQSLIQTVIRTSPENVIVQGLCAALLGIAYEFSTKDSPIPRATLHAILASRMGREQYIDKITKLREHHLLRDFEVLSQGLDASQSGGLPDVFFDKSFVDFMKDNFSRLLRAIDRDPGLEIPVITNGIQKGISRELVDSLRTQLEDKVQALQVAEANLLSIENKLAQEQADHRRAKELATNELNKSRSDKEHLERQHEEYIRKMKEEHLTSMNKLQADQMSRVATLEIRIEQMQSESEASAAKVRERNETETTDLKNTIKKLEDELVKTSRDHVQDLRIADEEYSAKVSSAEGRASRAEEKSSEAASRAKRAEEKLLEAILRAKNAEDSLKAKEEERRAVQGELDDLLMVFADLEEKRAKDKVIKTPMHYWTSHSFCGRSN
jgi:hypothetical protein